MSLQLPPPWVVFRCLALRPLCWLCFGYPLPVRGPMARCGWVRAASLLLSSPSLLAAPLGAHLISSQSVLVKVSACSGIAWLWAEQSFKSNPPLGGHRGGGEQTATAGRGLQDALRTGKVQYSQIFTNNSHPWLCTDPSVAPGGLGAEMSPSAEEGMLRGAGDVWCWPPGSVSTPQEGLAAFWGTAM